ncbi:MAG: LVIVD repeat-containing protein, partial [Candidatus Heimdallarchaeota archaeon]
MADGSEGIHIIDIQDPTNPIITDSFNTPGYARKVALQGNTLYVADGDGGVQILDVSNPEQIIHVTDIDLPYTYDVALFGGDLIVGAADGVYTVSVGTIANFANTWYPNSYEAPTIWDVRVVDGIAYLACGYDGIHVVDVSNPNQPVLLSNYTAGAFVDIRKIDINGKFLYAVSDNSYWCFDISDPTDIKQVFGLGG